MGTRLARALARRRPGIAVAEHDAAHRSGTCEDPSMLAITTLNAGWQTFFFATALILFVLHGIGFDQRATRLRFDGLGLAVFVFVFFWNALAAT